MSLLDARSESEAQEDLEAALRRVRREGAAAVFAAVSTLGVMGGAILYLGPTWTNAGVWLGGVVTTWFLFKPWRRARARVAEIERELRRLEAGR